MVISPRLVWRITPCGFSRLALDEEAAAAGAGDEVVPVAGEVEVADGDGDASSPLSFLKILEKIPMITVGLFIGGWGLRVVDVCW